MLLQKYYYSKSIEGMFLELILLVFLKECYVLTKKKQRKIVEG